MYKSYEEIFKQDESLGKTLKYVLSKKSEITNFLEKEDYDEIIFVACGSSYWLSLSAVETYFEKFGIRCSAVTSGDIVMNPKQYIGRYGKPLIITPSRSGNTTETLRALSFLKQQYNNARILGIVEYENASLANHADLLLSLPWANEQSVCQTRSFSNLYLTCILVAAIFGNDHAMISHIEAYITEFPDLSKSIEELVKDISNDRVLQNLITLGNGRLYGLSCEGAYITIEMAQAPAHFFYTLEFRHGPIVLINETYLVVLYSNGSQNDLEEKLIKDIQAKGAKVLVISSNNGLESADFLALTNKNYPPEVVGLFASFVTQALAYQKALRLQVNPDQPKDLVPWIAI